MVRWLVGGTRARAPPGGLLRGFWGCHFLEPAAVQLGLEVGEVEGPCLLLWLPVKWEISS